MSCNIQDTFKLENYLTKLPFNMRKTLISLEIGRDINERKCVRCNTVGDEFHCLLSCFFLRKIGHTDNRETEQIYNHTRQVGEVSHRGV